MATLKEIIAKPDNGATFQRLSDCFTEAKTKFDKKGGKDVTTIKFVTAEVTTGDLMRGAGPDTKVGYIVWIPRKALTDA